VADADHAGEVERFLEPAEPVDPGGDVEEGGRPATAAAPAEAPVFEVPGRPAAAGEIGDELVLEAQVIARAPEAAVDQDRGGEWALALWQRQLAELVAPLTVGVPERLDDAEVSR
jgi:hypothetical protein